MPLQISRLLGSPDIYPQRFEGSELVFVHMSRASYGRSIFTDQRRIVTASDEAWGVPLVDLIKLIERSKEPAQSPAFMFHIAHCGSTLLSRALDRPGRSLVIREPSTLRQLAASPAPESGTDRASGAWSRGLGALLRLLSRQYDASERVLVKANVPVNFVLEDIDRLAPGVTGILLYSPLEDYLVAALKSEQRRRWAQYVCRELESGIRATRGFADLDLTNLTPARAAAVLWSAQLGRFRQAMSQAAGLRLLNCDRLYATPREVMRQCADHLGIELADRDIDEVAASELFTRHAKAPQMAYSNSERLAELHALRQQYQHESADALAWCGAQGVDVTPDLAESL